MWKIIDFNPNYEVSDEGIVRRVSNKHVLKGCITSGYRSVKLTFENSRQQRFYVHRLVAMFFIPNDDKNKTVVNHKDGNKLNNNVDNLEWVSPRENNLHYYRLQKEQNKKHRSGGKPIPVNQYTLDGKLVQSFPSIKKASLETGFSVVQIARCVHEEITHVGQYIFKAQ